MNKTTDQSERPQEKEDDGHDSEASRPLLHGLDLLHGSGAARGDLSLERDTYPASLNSKACEIDKLKPALMAAGAFLLVLGATMIPAGAALVVTFGLAQNLSNTSLLTTIGVFLASVGAGLLAYGVGARAREGSPMPS